MSKKSKNKTNKGARTEREFIKVLENSGNFKEIWKPCKCSRGAKSRYTSNDIFGLFDIMTLEDNFRGVLHLFQVKANKSDYYKAKKKVKEFAYKHIVCTYVVLRVKKGLWRVAEFGVDDDGDYEYEYYVNDMFREVKKV